MLSELYVWLGLGLGLVDVALTSDSASCTYGLVNIPAYIVSHFTGKRGNYCDGDKTPTTTLKLTEIDRSSQRTLPVCLAE